MHFDPPPSLTLFPFPFTLPPSPPSSSFSPKLTPQDSTSKNYELLYVTDLLTLLSALPFEPTLFSGRSNQEKKFVLFLYMKVYSVHKEEEEVGEEVGKIPCHDQYCYLRD